MTDLTQHWKENRYVVIDHAGLDIKIEPYQHFVLLTDVSYWCANWDRLETWCRLNGGVHQGMSITFENEQQLTAFSLKWA